MFIWIRMYFSADFSRQSLFIKVKQRNSFHKHQLYSNFTRKMIIATSFECRVPVASLKKQAVWSLSPDHRLLSYSSNTTFFEHGEEEVYLITPASARKKHNTNIWKHLIWFSEKKAGYMMKMLKRNNSYCKFQEHSEVI